MRKSNRYIVPIIRILILVMAICFLIIGINRGEQDITFVKAIFICLECIGIG